MSTGTAVRKNVRAVVTAIAEDIDQLGLDQMARSRVSTLTSFIRKGRIGPDILQNLEDTLAEGNATARQFASDLRVDTDNKAEPVVTLDEPAAVVEPPKMAAVPLDAEDVPNSPAVASKTEETEASMLAGCPATAVVADEAVVNPTSWATDAAPAWPDWMIEDLKRSGITPEDALRLGFRPVSKAEYRDLLGFGLDRLSDGYAIPFLDPATGLPMLTPDGRPFVRVKLEQSTQLDGSTAKYLSPKNGGQHAYVLPEVHAAFLQGTVRTVTEGEKKAVAGTRAGFRAIGLVGNWGWKGPGGDLLPELACYATAGSEWLIVWDADAAINPDFARATAAFAGALLKCGCAVRVCYLPTVGEAKTGLDDYLLHPDGGLSHLAEYIDANALIVRSAERLETQVILPADVLLAKLRDLGPDAELEQVAAILDVIATHNKHLSLKEQILLRENLVKACHGAGVGSPGRLVDEYLRSGTARASDGVQGNAVLFRHVEPADEPVEGAALADEIEQTYRKYVVFTDAAVVALTLWTFVPHVHDAFDVSPLLVVQSPEKRCAKTLTLDILEAFLPRPVRTANQTQAVLFRLIERDHPTLVIDESDQWFKNEDLLAMVNAGHRRQGAYVQRCIGDDNEVRSFCVWAPKILAVKGRLPDTIEDRAIILPMRRKSKNERVERWRCKYVEALTPLLRKLTRWGQDHLEQLREADPSVPEGLHDRAGDNWRPLLAIADTLGASWRERARQAAISLTNGSPADAEGSLPTELLRDIRAIFMEMDMTGGCVGMRLPQWHIPILFGSALWKSLHNECLGINAGLVAMSCESATCGQRQASCHSHRRCRLV